MLKQPCLETTHFVWQLYAHGITTLRNCQTVYGENNYSAGNKLLDIAIVYLLNRYRRQNTFVCNSDCLPSGRRWTVDAAVEHWHHRLTACVYLVQWWTRQTFVVTVLSEIMTHLAESVFVSYIELLLTREITILFTQFYTITHFFIVTLPGC